MPKFENFYENIQEAQMRLRGTVVLYDKDPVYVWAVINHKGDGVFRIYISPVEDVDHCPGGMPINQIPHTHAALGEVMDEWMATPNVMSNSKFRILRKKMNSPLFNRFRPFPLGMMNAGKYVYYLERQPQRPKTEQGLVSSAVHATPISAAVNTQIMKSIDLFTPSFRDCVVGDYPSPNNVLAGITNPRYDNEAVAFHRQFALVKGPIDTLFLAYKSDVIGALPNGDFSRVRLGKDFAHCREVVDELNLFNTIVV